MLISQKIVKIITPNTRNYVVIIIIKINTIIIVIII